MIHVPDLLRRGGLTQDEAAGWAAIGHGRVQINEWTIGLGEGTLPRWVLRGVTITVSGRSMRISDCGSKILRSSERAML